MVMSTSRDSGQASPDSSAVNLMSLLAAMPKTSPNQSAGSMSAGGNPHNIAPHIEVLPPYKREEKERWTSAAAMYSQMLSQGGSPDQSPGAIQLPSVGSEPRSINQLCNRTPDPYENSSNYRSSSHLNSQPTATAPRRFSRQISWHPSVSNGDEGQGTGQDDVIDDFCRSWSGMVTPSRLGGLTMSGQNSRGELTMTPTSLELEAIAAVHELSFAVDSISVSDMLPRTPELIFVNVTTVEGSAYCLELTLKGWRVCSKRHDCMNCDYTSMDLHTRYYDTVYALMDDLSDGYRQRFGEKLASRLRMLQQTREAAGPDNQHLVHGNQTYLAQAPASSYSQLPQFHDLMKAEKEEQERLKERQAAGALDVAHLMLGGQDDDGHDPASSMKDLYDMQPITISVRHPDHAQNQGGWA